jgi:hypothetical protein
VPKRLLAAATAALGLAASTVVATANPAAADDLPCDIRGFSPTNVVVGLTPITKRFGVRTADCFTVEGWNIDVVNSFTYTYDSAPYETFTPSYNSDAGFKNVVVQVHNGDYFTTEKTFVRGFSLKRRTAWANKTFNASPEPVRKGKPVTLKGRLVITDWDSGHYVPARVGSVKVQFRTSNGSYRTVKSGVRTDSRGWVNTRVTASQTGVWRLVYSGNTIAGPATTTGDAVKVR